MKLIFCAALKLELVLAKNIAQHPDLKDNPFQGTRLCSPSIPMKSRPPSIK